MSPSLVALACLLSAPPPPPPSEVDDEEPAPAEPAPEPAPEPSPPPKPEVELDARGYPILPYAEEVDDPTAGIEYAEQTPPDPELEYADPVDPPPLEYSEGHPRPAPSKEELDRQGLAGLRAKARRSNESPQRFAIELKFGPYTPAVDRRHTGDGLGPYATIYGPTDDMGNATGQPKPRLFSVIAFDWQFVYLAGPLSIGTSIGFFRDKAQALVAEPEPDATTVRSPADKTTFNIFPVTLLAGYRFELLADRFRVPLVPYAKAGLGYGFWWSTSGNGKVSENDKGEKGRGGNIGWQVNAGMMLRLDFIDRGSARELDRVTGINHTYLFGEYQISRLNAFGTGSRVDVGDDTWLVGLAMEL